MSAALLGAVYALAAVLLGITAWLRWAEKRHTDFANVTASDEEAS